MGNISLYTYQTHFYLFLLISAVGCQPRKYNTWNYNTRDNVFTSFIINLAVAPRPQNANHYLYRDFTNVCAIFSLRI